MDALGKAISRWRGTPFPRPPKAPYTKHPLYLDDQKVASTVYDWAEVNLRRLNALWAARDNPVWPQTLVAPAWLSRLVNSRVQVPMEPDTVKASAGASPASAVDSIQRATVPPTAAPSVPEHPVTTTVPEPVIASSQVTDTVRRKPRTELEEVVSRLNHKHWVRACLDYCNAPVAWYGTEQGVYNEAQRAAEMKQWWAHCKQMRPMFLRDFVEHHQAIVSSGPPTRARLGRLPDKYRCCVPDLMTTKEASSELGQFAITDCSLCGEAHVGFEWTELGGVRCTACSHEPSVFQKDNGGWSVNGGKPSCAQIRAHSKGADHLLRLRRLNGEDFVTRDDANLIAKLRAALWCAQRPMAIHGFPDVINLIAHSQLPVAGVTVGMSAEQASLGCASKYVGNVMQACLARVEQDNIVKIMEDRLFKTLISDGAHRGHEDWKPDGLMMRSVSEEGDIENHVLGVRAYRRRDQFRSKVDGSEPAEVGDIAPATAVKPGGAENFGSNKRNMVKKGTLNIFIGHKISHNHRRLQGCN